MDAKIAPQGVIIAREFTGIIGNWRSLRFGWAVLKGFRENQSLPVRSLFLPFNGWILPETRLSDHASFWDAGLPAVMVTDTAFKSLELALHALPPASTKSQ